jgi:hypothetical protein
MEQHITYALTLIVPLLVATRDPRPQSKTAGARAPTVFHSEAGMAHITYALT